MTESQQIEFNKMKDKMDENAHILSEMNRKTDGIYYALVGNDLSQDGGLVKQIKDMKARHEDFETAMEKRVTQLEAAFIRWKGIAVGLLISGGVIGYLLKIIVNKYL